MRPLPVTTVASFLFFLLAARTAPGGDERQAADRFSGPPQEPPSRDFDFLHLRLECAFDWDAESVEATVVHRVAAFRDGVRHLELDAVGIEVRAVTLGDGPSLRHEVLPEKLRIDLGREAKREEELEVVIRYAARPEFGLYFRKPSEDTPDSPRQVWTQGETHEARHWIPAFDHPVEKLTSEVLVTVPRPLIAVSNGRLVETRPQGDDAQVFHWAQEKPHTVYLITVAAGDFAVWESEAAGVPLTAYTEKRYAARAARSFELTGDMLEFFNQRTGFPYPWAKYAQVCVDGFPFGGMENTSATTLTDRTLRDERAALDGNSVGLVAHELAHQWFGDLVTCKDWADIWLNESFATFYENLYREHREGWDEAAFERHEFAVEYKEEDRTRYRRSLSTRRYRHAEDVFDSHSYPKGARILDMLRYVVGDAAFDAGIELYLRRHAFRSVETADFRTAMEDATGQSLAWFFDQWVHAGGHPRYRVTQSWDAESRVLQLTVEQTQEVDGLTPLYRMPFVIAAATPSGKVEHRVWVRERKETFSFPLAERPRLVHFDPGDRVLKDLEFEKSREELLYQLGHDDDVLGRHAAAGALERHAAESEVRAALLERLEKEPFWGVRLAVVASLAKAHGGSAVLRALAARLGTEPDARVRRALAGALGEAGGEIEGGEDAALRLRRLIAEDRSYEVVAAALRSLAKLLGKEARGDLIALLETPSHEEVIRTAAIDSLSREEGLSDEERKELTGRLLALAARGQPVPVRTAAQDGLAAAGKGSDEVFRFLTAALEDRSPVVRRSAVQALEALGDRRAIEPLRARRAKEKPRVFRDPVDEINRVIERLESGGDARELRGQVEELQRENEDLKKRVSALEKRGGG